MKKLVLKNVRLSFPSLFQHATYQGQSLEKFEATFLINKDDPQLKTVQAAIKEVGEAEFGKDWGKARMPIIDGVTKDYDGYEGTWALKATTKKRPVVVDRDKSPLVEDDGKPYAGCYVNASITINAFGNNYGKFVVANLNAVQFTKDGDSFGGDSGGGADDFDALDGDTDDIPFESEAAPF